MRAIVTREYRHAVAERRDAEEAWQAAHHPPRTPVRWRKPASPKRKPGRIERERAADAEAVRRDWAQRHPALARDERAIRKQIAATEAEYGRKANGTPETHAHAARVSQGSLARLYTSGAIDAVQLAAAADIADVAERIGRDVTVRTASLETRISGGRVGDGGFFERLSQVRREIAYGRWRRALASPGPVLAMIVDDEALTIVAKRHGMHHRRAKALLLAALDLWGALIGEVAHEVDEAALARAHARLCS